MYGAKSLVTATWIDLVDIFVVAMGSTLWVVRTFIMFIRGKRSSLFSQSIQKLPLNLGTWTLPDLYTAEWSAHDTNWLSSEQDRPKA